MMVPATDAPFRDPRLRALRMIAMPALAADCPLATWDQVIRITREARLLGVLHHRLHAAGMLDVVPTGPRGHLDAGGATAAYRARMMRVELGELAKALTHLDAPVVALKGAAYLIGGGTAAAGRIPADVDVLVPQAHLAAAEAALLAAGWESTVTDAYDDRYYREWSHELPPMRYAGREVEVDLHHAITPPTSRFHPPTDVLLRDCVPVTGTPWRVLSSLDQILHVAVHLTQDSELSGRVRELVDFHALAGDHLRGPDDWDALVDRARGLGLLPPLALTVTLTRDLLDPAFAGNASATLRETLTRTTPRIANAIARNTLLPLVPDRRPGLADRAARLAAVVRYHRMRMPPALLARHLFAKTLRSLRRDRTTESGAPE